MSTIGQIDSPIIDRTMEAFRRSVDRRNQLDRNAIVGDDGVPFENLERRLKSKPNGFDPAKEAVEFLANGHIQICYCCPFVSETIAEWSDRGDEVKKTIDKLLRDHPDICSRGLVGNIATWRRLLDRDPEEEIYNSLQHCLARMAAISKLWPKRLSKESINASIKFAVRLRVFLHQSRWPFQHRRFNDKELRTELYELADDVLKRLVRLRTSKKLTKGEAFFAHL